MNHFDLSKGTIDKDDMYIDCSLPTNMYHYTSKEGLLGILKGEELYFSHMAYVNDTNELMDIFELLLKMEKSIKEIGKKAFKNSCDSSNKEADKNIKIIEASVDEIMKYVMTFKTIGSSNEGFVKKSYDELHTFSLSFCKNEDSLCTWSNYTDKSGYNISINANNLKDYLKQSFKSEKIAFNYGSVIYDDGEKKEVIIKMFEEFFEAFKSNSGEVRELQTHLAMLIILHAPFFKKSVLKQEQEIRFSIIVQKDILKKYINFKQSNGLTIPYFNMEGNFSEYYEGIKIGPLVKEFNKESLFLFLTYMKNEQQKDKLEYNLKIEKENITKSQITYRW